MAEGDRPSGQRVPRVLPAQPARQHRPRIASGRFRVAEFHYLPCVQWDTYFPRPLRFFPHAYDRLIGTRFRRAAQLLLFKLEKGPLDADAVAAPASAPAG